MSDITKSRFDNLPDIPDFPDSPLSGWRHYGITYFAQRKIQSELERLGYPGYLIGLRTEYTIGEGENEKTYSIAFGRVPPDDDPSRGFKESDPLSDESMIELYNDLSVLAYNYMPDEFANVPIQLDATITGSEISKTYRCRKVKEGECDQGHVNQFKICKKEQGKWSCTHTDCPKKND